MLFHNVSPHFHTVIVSTNITHPSHKTFQHSFHCIDHSSGYENINKSNFPFKKQKVSEKLLWQHRVSLNVIHATRTLLVESLYRSTFTAAQESSMLSSWEIHTHNSIQPLIAGFSKDQSVTYYILLSIGDDVNVYKNQIVRPCWS